jgi:tRNA threonylcarbamoyladenosine biosynthesis protein TsaE
MRHDVDDEAGTGAVARALAATLGAGDVVHLVGPLGAGKTAFVRHAAAALGVTEPVTSPTFAIAHAYTGADGLSVSHLDLYRARRVTVEELADLDPYLDERAVLFVEWPEAGAGALPQPTVVVRLEPAGGDARTITIERVGRDTIAPGCACSPSTPPPTAPPPPSASMD